MKSPEQILMIARRVGLAPRQVGQHEFAVPCPQRALHKHNDAHPSCRLNDEKGTFYCDVCRCGGGTLDFARMVGVDIANGASSPPPNTPPPFEGKRSDGKRPPLHFESHGPISLAIQNKVKQLLGKTYPPEAWAKVGVLEGVVKEFPAIAFPLPSGGFKACLYTLPDRRREKPYTFWYTDGGKPDLILVGEGDRVLLTAGEWDLLAALAAGVPCVATGTAGESSWKEEWSKTLVGKRVLIAYDVDEAGRRGSEKVAASLAAAGGEVYIVRLPLSGNEEEDGKDLSDFLAVHGVEALRKVLAESAEHDPYSPRGTASQGPGPDFSTSHQNSANSANCAMGGATSNGASWEPPLPFEEVDLPPFPTESLPGRFRDFVEAEAVATQTPLDLPAMLVLPVCAAACARKVVVHVKPGHIEPLNLYSVVALPPGERKTAVLHDVTAAVEEWEESQVRRMKPILAEALALREIEEAALRQAKKAAAEAETPDREHLLAEVTQKARHLSESEVPFLPRLLADDITPERLASLLFEQKGRMAIFSAEGGVFDLMAGRYADRKSPNFDVFLKGHAGDTLRVDRSSRPPEYVKNPALTIGLAVQPDVIQGLAGKPGFLGRGLIGRFLYARPRSILGHRSVRARPVPDSLREVYRQQVLSLYDLPDGTDASGGPVPHVLRFHPAALERLIEFEAWVEPQLDEFGSLGGMTDWGAKLVGAVIRIAGNLHMALNSLKKGPWELPIHLETVCDAIRIGEYLIPHAKAAYASMEADPGVADAKHLLAWIRRHQLPEFSKRQAFEGTKGRFKRVVVLDRPLGLLAEHNYIRERRKSDTSSPGRSPSPTYEVNPLLYSQYSHNSHNSPPIDDSANSANSANKEGQGEQDE